MRVQQGYWKAITPLIQQIKGVIKLNSLHPPSKAYAKLTDLESLVNAMQDKMNNTNRPDDRQHFTSVAKNSVEMEIDNLLGLVQSEPSNLNNVSNNTVDKLTMRVNHMEDVVNVLKQRTSGDGINFRNFSFQSHTELKNGFSYL